MNPIHTEGPYMKITVPKDPFGTATYAVLGKATEGDLQSFVYSYYMLPVVEGLVVKEYVDLPTATIKDESQVLVPKARVLGLHPGSAWTSDDFDAPLEGELGFGEE